MLTDSCSSLLQRLATRVRGASSINDNVGSKAAPARRSPNVNQLSATRTRLEDKYSTILDKYTRRKRHTEQACHDYRRTHERDHSYYRREDSPYVREEKTLEPSVTRTVIKSPTSVVLSEKAYPYVKSTAVKDLRREKTPGYHHHRADRQALLTSDSYRRYGRHKSGHAETHTRKVRPYRNGKSEQLESRSAALRLARPMKVDASTGKGRTDDASDPEKTPTSSVNPGKDAAQAIGGHEDTDPAVTERAAKRKEIQSLILKYAAMEETYSQLAAGGQVKMRPSTTDIIASKYRKDIQSERKNAARGAAVVSAASVVSNADAVHHAIVSCRATRTSKYVSVAAGSRQCCFSLSKTAPCPPVADAAVVLCSSHPPLFCLPLVLLRSHSLTLPHPLPYHLAAILTPWRNPGFADTTAGPVRGGRLT